MSCDVTGKSGTHRTCLGIGPGPNLVIEPASANSIGWPPRVFRSTPGGRRLWGALAAVSAVVGAYYGTLRGDGSIGAGLLGTFVGGAVPVVGPIWLARRKHQ